MKKTLIILMIVLLSAVLIVSCDDKKEVANYTVAFDLDGGTLDGLKDQTVVEGEYASNPGSPTKDSYIFAGWYDGDEEFDFENTKIEKNYTLKAKWSCTVAFDLDDGTLEGLKNQTVVKGEYATNPGSPTKSGKVFKYWSLDNNAGFNFDTAITETITLTAVWGDPSTKGEIITLGKKSDVGIAWLVLDVDKGSKRALLISKDILDTMEFDDNSSNNTYASSDIKSYLNNTGDEGFIKSYELSSDYMLKVDTTSDTTTVGSGSEYVFLLSKTEAEKTDYFAGNDARKANYNGSSCGWWLRTAYPTDSMVDFVYSGGSLMGASPNSSLGLRPAFWYKWN